MHVVIPVQVEPHNRSLPHALASIAQHTDLIPVTVGHDTGLCELHLPTVQQPGRVHAFANTDLALLTACRTGWMSDPFIWTADDIYWLRPAEPIRWAIGKLEHATSASLYAQRKRHTAAWLDSRGLPTHDYEAHVPLLVNRDAMLDTLTYIARDPLLDKRSVYGNLTGTPDLVAPDVKLRHRTAPLPETPWVSTAGDPTRYSALGSTVARSLA